MFPIFYHKTQYSEKCTTFKKNTIAFLFSPPLPFQIKLGKNIGCHQKKVFNPFSVT
jgi:hypothetical protein